jgi:K+-transporting ATPase KdpF subunit
VREDLRAVDVLTVAAGALSVLVLVYLVVALLFPEKVS